MSDFGANIFDDEPPARRESPAPKHTPATEGAPPANPAPPVPPAPHANAPQQQARPAPPAPPREPRREEGPPREHGRAPGRGPGRHTAFRPASQGRPHQDLERRPQREPAGTTRQAPREGVAVLVDLDALQAEARAQRGELAMQRLRQGLGGERTVQRAIAFASASVTPPAGFELLVATPGTHLADGVRFAATAIELLAAASGLVLAPPSAANRQLAKALRATGHLVDLAGFDATAASGERMRVLGRDCLFVP